MMFEARHLIVRDSIDVILRHLEGLPPSDKVDQLRVWVHECLQEAEQWGASAPTPRERDVLMKRVLALHVEVTSLEREAKLGTVTDVIAEP